VAIAGQQSKLAVRIEDRIEMFRALLTKIEATQDVLRGVAERVVGR